MIKRYKPTTSSIRQKVNVDRTHLWKGSPLKSLSEGVAHTGGRNNQGRITVRYKTSHMRKVLRTVLFKRYQLDGITAEVVRIEYDPNRSAHLALLKYNKDNKEEFCYIIAPKDIKIGQKLETSSTKRIDFLPGNAMKLEFIKDGTTVHCVELKVGAGAILARSAGASAQIVGKDEKGRIIVRLSSGEEKIIDKNCYATIGSVSNEDHSNIVLGKAGASFWRGRRPHVRGIAMNPVDHSMGGRANGGRHPSSPQGLCAKGKKTRKNKRTTHTIVKGRKRK